MKGQITNYQLLALEGYFLSANSAHADKEVKMSASIAVALMSRLRQLEAKVVSLPSKKQLTYWKSKVVRLQKENINLAQQLLEANNSVVAFGMPYAILYAKKHGLDDGYLFPVHFAMLEAAWADMSSFEPAKVP